LLVSAELYFTLLLCQVGHMFLFHGCKLLPIYFFYLFIDAGVPHKNLGEKFEER